MACFFLPLFRPRCGLLFCDLQYMNNPVTASGIYEHCDANSFFSFLNALLLKYLAIRKSPHPRALFVSFLIVHTRREDTRSSVELSGRVVKYL